MRIVLFSICRGQMPMRADADEGNSAPILTAGVRGLNGSAQCAPSIRLNVIRGGTTSYSTYCVLDGCTVAVCFWTTYVYLPYPTQCLLFVLLVGTFHIINSNNNNNNF